MSLIDDSYYISSLFLEIEYRELLGFVTLRPIYNSEAFLILTQGIENPEWEERE